jgi:hypothetical protein
MIVRNIDTQQVWIYDVIQTGTGYAAQLSSAVSPGQTQPGVLGPIGLEWKVAGIAPLNANLFPANLVTDDLVMRNTNTGALQVYNIRSDTLTGSAALTPPAANPIAATSTVGGIAVDFTPPSLRLDLSAGAGNGRLQRRRWRSRGIERFAPRCR